MNCMIDGISFIYAYEEKNQGGIELPDDIPYGLIFVRRQEAAGGIVQYFYRHLDKLMIDIDWTAGIHPECGIYRAYCISSRKVYASAQKIYLKQNKLSQVTQPLGYTVTHMLETVLQRLTIASAEKVKLRLSCN